MHLHRLPLAALLLISPVIAGSTAQPPEKSPPMAWCHLTTEMASAVTQGWGKTRTDSAIGGGAITIAGQRHAKGLGTHSQGEMVFPLGGIFADKSRAQSAWAAVYYSALRERGMTHAQALRCLGQRWLKIIWKMWQTGTAYDAALHMRNQLAHGSWVLQIQSK